METSVGSAASRRVRDKMAPLTRGPSAEPIVADGCGANGVESELR
jgi:hypothetical protein